MQGSGLGVQKNQTMNIKTGTGRNGIESVRIGSILGGAKYFVLDLAHGFVYLAHDAAQRIFIQG